MKCADCGEPLADAARFCSACGLRVARAPAKIEPVLDRAKIGAPDSPGSGSRREPVGRRPPPVPMPGRTVERPAAVAAPRAAPIPGKARPAALVVLGIVLGIAAVWSAKVDDAASKAVAARRLALATSALPTTAQQATLESGAFSTRQALQGLYGSYDPHLDGVFWTVTGAPREWDAWNGRPVLIKPLVSKSDDSGTRHALVTSSVEVKDGLVVKQGVGCPSCKSLLGAALFERRAGAWALVKEIRFMRVEGAYGAPPQVTVDFPRQGGAEVRIAGSGNASAQTAQAVLLHAAKPAGHAQAQAVAGTR